MRNIQKEGFTLVELVVVITIIAILSAVGFVGYSEFVISARDSNRSETVNNIQKGLALYITTSGKAPEIEDEAIISSNGTIFSYQGYFGESAAKKLNMQGGIVDPKDKTPYIYALDDSKEKSQIIAYYENTKDLSYVDKAYAVDYTQRKMYSVGDQIGVLFDSYNNLITSTGVDIMTTNSGTTYTTVFSTTETVSYSGYILSALISSKQPETRGECPDGFIRVPGNPEFSTKTFCVAKYEMSYNDGYTPNSTNGDWNTISYVAGKQIGSQAGKYPIVDITQPQAIVACASMGVGYHLITNNEWMTIARNIEGVALNWSSGKIGQGNLSNGVSNDTSLGCAGQIDTTYPTKRATKTGKGTSDACNLKRKHKLTNGEEIWDLAGNVWEHVNKEITGTTTMAGVVGEPDSDGIYALADMKKYGSMFGLGKSAGMGSVRNVAPANNIFLHGASAYNGDDAGVFSLHLHWAASGSDRYVGFRCVR